MLGFLPALSISFELFFIKLMCGSLVFRPGCHMSEIWDLEDIENRGKTPTCQVLGKDPTPYFKRVFRNKVYDVLQVLDKPGKT